jgi:hypothetical protein
MFEEIDSLTWSPPGLLLKPYFTALWLTKSGCRSDFYAARHPRASQRGYFPTKTAPPTVANSSPTAPENVVKKVRLSVELRMRGFGMRLRMIAILAVLAASFALGGCFHHNQVAMSEPQALPPLK